jgi:Rieske Fe-S protein
MTDEREPVWRRDFPVTAEGEEEVTRREFVRYLVLASGTFGAASVGVALYATLRSVNQGEARAILPARSLPAGSAHLFRYPTPQDPALVLRLPSGELRGFSQKCTHLGCVVTWNPAEGRLLCPCHDGCFDGATGQVLAGPPQRPLERIDVEERADGMIWALRGGIV